MKGNITDQFPNKLECNLHFIKFSLFFSVPTQFIKKMFKVLHYFVELIFRIYNVLLTSKN